MQTSKLAMSALGACLLILNLTTTAQAESFSESFKAFVLGEEAEAATRNLLPASSSRSYQCMRCHDGSRGKAITLKSADSPLIYTGHINSNHPVGMRYTDYARRSPGSYVPVDRLNHNIALENGTVTCISCHQTDDREPPTNNRQAAHETGCTTSGQLTVKSDLCMSCHMM